MNWQERVRSALLDALAIVVPVDCAGCGVRDRSLCDDCRGELVACAQLRQRPGGFPIVAATSYESVARGVMLALKSGRTSLAHALAPMLVAAVSAARTASVSEQGAQQIELCGVPSTRAAFRERGFDPVRVLARSADIRMPRVLHPAKAHAAQKALGRIERAQNLTGVYRARTPLHGRRFIIIDDVTTTGATIDAVAAALVDAGATVVGAAVIAATPRTGGASQAHGRRPAADG